jgi:hypothetical protein
MPTTLVINPPKQRITFTLPTTYSDGTTALPAGAIADIAIQVGNVTGGPYTKTIKDTTLTPDSTGLCEYPLASLGVDLTKPTYAVLATEITGPGGTLIDSTLSPEIGFQNLAPAPPQNPSVG